MVADCGTFPLGLNMSPRSDSKCPWSNEGILGLDKVIDVRRAGRDAVFVVTWGWSQSVGILF